MGNQLLADFSTVRTSVQYIVVASSCQKTALPLGHLGTVLWDDGPALGSRRNPRPHPPSTIFWHWMWMGEYAIQGGGIRKLSVKQYLRPVGQAYAGMGANDIRLDPPGKTEYRLGYQLRSYTREYPPYTRVKPTPLPIIMATCTRLR